MQMKEVQSKKKEVKSKNLYLKVYELIKEGQAPKDITLILNISKQKLQYYLNYLKNKDYIYKKGYGVWEVKKEVKEISVGPKARPTTNLHSLIIKFPILKGKIYDSDWKIGEKLNNWIPKYKQLDKFKGLNIKNNNGKSLSVFVKSRDIENLDQIDELAKKVQVYVCDYFKREGVILDYFGTKIQNMHIATEDKEAQGMRRKGEKYTLDLNKKAEKVFPNDDIDAKAWIDGSPFDFTAETNDKDWKRLYLTMPFNVNNLYHLFYEFSNNLNSLTKNVDLFGEHMKSHVGAIQELTKVAKTINKDKQQSRLNKWM